MSIKAFIPELWVARLLAAYEKALVFGALANRDYEGEIRNLGDTVKISGVGPVTVSAYTGTVTYQDLEAEQQNLVIDQRDYWAFKVDDADAAQAGVMFMDQAMRNAAYSVRDTVDRYIAGLYTQAGNITESTPINSLNVFAAILSLGQALDEANVPEEGRWLVIPPWLKVKLVQAKLVAENTTNEAWSNGRVGRCAGFDIYQSNNVANDGTDYYCMAGTRDAISYAGQIDPARVEALRAESAFEDKIRGEILFGAKVVRPDALAVLDATILAEP